jgi:hypothetical protein
MEHSLPFILGINTSTCRAHKLLPISSIIISTKFFPTDLGIPETKSARKNIRAFDESRGIDW